MFLFLKKEDEDKDTDKISVEEAATCFFAKEWENLNLFVVTLNMCVLGLPIRLAASK